MSLDVIRINEVTKSKNKIDWYYKIENLLILIIEIYKYIFNNNNKLIIIKVIVIIASR